MFRILVGPPSLFAPVLFGGGSGAAVADGIDELFVKVLSERVVYGDNDLTTMFAITHYNDAGKLVPATGLSGITRQFRDPRTAEWISAAVPLIETSTPGMYKAESVGSAHTFAAAYDGRTVDCVLDVGVSLNVVARFTVRALRRI